MGEIPFEILDFGQVQVQVQVREITVDGLRTYLDGESARIRQNLEFRDRMAPRKAVIIVDGSVSLMPPPEARQMQADWFNANKDLLKLVTHKMGFVLPNAFLRGFMSAVFFLSGPPVPMKTHASVDEAVPWAIAEALSIGGEVSDDLRLDGVVAYERAKQAAIYRASGMAQPQV